MGYAMAFSGGGVKGAAHVGVLKALKEEGLLPDFVAGTSAGAIVAGLYAAGMTIPQMEELVHGLAKKGRSYLDPDYEAILELVPGLLAGKKELLPGLLKGNRLCTLLHQLTGGIYLEEAVLPFVIPAVDLFSGDTVVFTNQEKTQETAGVRWERDGLLSQAMMASASVPAVFAPRKIKEYLLVDGGVSDNLPVNLLYAAGGRSIVAVDAGSVYKAPEHSSMMEVVSHSFSVMSRQLKECTSGKEGFLLRPAGECSGGLLDFDIMVECMEAGYEDTKGNMGKIKAYLESQRKDDTWNS